MKMSRRRLLQFTAAAAFAQPGHPDDQPTLWYKQPAAKWTEALPIGNGRLGAMVFGGVETERLQLNDDTLWSGPPEGDWNNPDARNHLADVRRLVMQEEKYVEADDECKKMQGPYNQSYQPLGDLFLKFEGASESSDYRREFEPRYCNRAYHLSRWSGRFHSRDIFQCAGSGDCRAPDREQTGTTQLRSHDGFFAALHH